MGGGFRLVRGMCHALVQSETEEEDFKAYFKQMREETGQVCLGGLVRGMTYLSSV